MILKLLEEKGFAFSNGVLGIGSFTYEYTTRDMYGFAMKATWGVVDGEEREIFKDPKTDRGFKKSAKGLLQVYRDENGVLKLKDQCTKEEEEQGLLKTVFLNGVLVRETSLSEIREKIDNYFKK
jgi:nicotinamide phosphoribosyltransferase